MMNSLISNADGKLRSLARSALLRGFVLVSSALLGAICICAQSPTELLAQADQLAESFHLAQAQPLYLQAEAKFHLSGDSLKELNAKLGRLRYSVQLGHYTSSREEIRGLLKTPSVENDPPSTIRCLEILGNIDMNQNTPAAFDDWTSLLLTAQGIGDAKSANRASGYLGIVSGINGDVGSAGKALFQALSKAEALGDVPGDITFGIWLANGMSSNGMGDSALHVLDRVNSFAKKNGKAEMPIQFSIAKVRALAESRTDEGRNAAKTLLQTTLADARHEGILGAQTDLLSQAGKMAIDNNDYLGAERSFAEQVQVAKQASLPSMQADGLLHLSQVYRFQGKNAKAELTVDRGIEVVRKVQESYDLPRFVAEKAEVQIALGRTKAAEILYDQASRLVEGLLINAPSSRVKSSMIGSMSDIYLAHFRLAWSQLHDGPEAFRVIESARGRALVNTLGSPEKVDSSVEKSPAELEISRLQKTLLHTNLTPIATSRVLAQLDHAYDNAFIAQDEQNGKEHGLLQRHPVSVDLLRQQLRPGDTFVEYVLDAKTSHAIEVTNAGLTIHSLPGRSEIDRLSKQFLLALNSKTDPSVPGRALYESLILPVIGKQTKSLIIVQDGSLYSIPFGALVDGNGTYLSQRLTVFAAPSATVYCALKMTLRARTVSKPFLGVAYSPQQSKEPLLASNTRGLFDLRGAKLTPLPFAREEIISAAGILGAGSVILDGDAASEASLKAQPLQSFRVIHLAAHAVGNEVEPDRAALVLSSGNGTDDGLWQAREILRTRLNADVIVLSACETGVGRLQGQEGVMNLARAFFTSGAKSVVASLWRVEDRSTATLMQSFYQHLAAGLTVSDALRQAQLDFIKEFGEKAQPYLWAGFEVIGDGTRKIELANNQIVTRSAR